MKRTRSLFFAIFTAAGLAITANGADAGTNSPADQVEANYTKSIEGRTADILKILALADTNKAMHVHDAVMAQYRSLRAWHDENDAKLKAAKADTNAMAQIRGSLKVIHDAFLAKLAEDLSPAQVEQVKDKMTYGKVQFTFNGYLSAYPNLAGEHQQKILEILKQAREEAMDGGSADEKTAIFQKAKGKINNYLSKQGVQSEKKKKTSGPATNAPSPQ
ncbi:MAG TPA: DUF3826 domain-containing protein [Candidatus Acidoferrales bacterium]|jgi:hypothetical protein|nr:DUF3826 domain-containing protein [Candidatus Acidoferrales bacterium]